MGHTQVQTLGPALKVLAHPTAVPEARPLLQGPSRSSVTVNRVPGMLRLSVGSQWSSDIGSWGSAQWR